MSSFALKIEEIDALRSNLLANISYLKVNKQKLRPEEYSTLINYHSYSLNVLENLKRIKIAEQQNPYNASMQRLYRHVDNPQFDTLADVYKPPQITNLWEKQFDTMVINPATYCLPPSNVWNLQRTLKDPNFL